ncbi:MAG: hypothetical protein ACRD5K_19290, partial [Candidatus Acidiferrales bacterium]
RRRAVFDVIPKKGRQDRSLHLEDFRLVTREFFHRLQYDTEKQFVILNGFITPAMAKKRKVEASGEDNRQEHTRYFEKLVGNADLKQLGAWLVELALIHHRDRTPYSYYGDTPKPDPLYGTATRWSLDVEAIKAVESIKASVIEPAKSNRTKAKHPEESANK